MKIVKEEMIPYNSGKAFEVERKQHIRISAESIVDYVSFSLNNLKERFDPACTKHYNSKIYISTGDRLYSNYANVMMTIVDDTYKGHHDLQCPMCSTAFYDKHYELYKAGDPVMIEALGDFLKINQREDLPDHGCLENIIEALSSYNISPEEVPNPLDLFQNMKIDDTSGNMVVAIDESRPEAGNPVHVEIRAEVSCLVALSVCPEFFAKATRGKTAMVQIFEE